MNALAIQLYLTIRYINLSFNYFGNFYRIIVYEDCDRIYVAFSGDIANTGKTEEYIIAKRF